MIKILDPHRAVHISYMSYVIWQGWVCLYMSEDDQSVVKCSFLPSYDGWCNILSTHQIYLLQTIHKLFESNILQNISDISQNISSISQLYLKFIANISQQYHKYISNISQLYLNYISIISQVHLNYFQKHFNYISNTSQTYLEYVSNKSQLYLTGSTTAWPPFCRFLAAFNGWRCSPAPDSCPLCTTSWGEQFKHIQFTHSIYPITHP